MKTYYVTARALAYSLVETEGTADGDILTAVNGYAWDRRGILWHETREAAVAFVRGRIAEAVRLAEVEAIAARSAADRAEARLAHLRSLTFDMEPAP